MEKMPHRVGVYLLTEHIASRDDVAWSEPYARYDGETYDVIGYGNIGSVVVTGEVETAGNNPDAVVEDYEKLSGAPGESIWAYPKAEAMTEVWKMLNQHVFSDPLSVRIINRVGRLQSELDDEPKSGADIVKTYKSLEESNQ
ncbi:hypothetical protein G9463_19355 [Haloarcula sp. JP-Z28]|uniref:hypothetical protein n=1 Tax=Haloarcula sp. JP-Z28 TaxID=2716715 RepID=UPI001404C3FD|nr:hypothetical protein [Haloarcula sp. JP-Z28]NHN65440.1 hypothetical protein [Haloarcula sp. JP-Z28]